MKKCLNCRTTNDDIVSWCKNCHGTSFEKIDKTKSINLILVEDTKKMANNEDKNAQLSLGKMYLFGLYDINKNVEKAEKYFVSAQRNGHKEAEEYLKLCNAIKNNNSYTIEPYLLKNNTNKFPAFICKNCESIIPIYNLSFNSHRTIQVYGTSFIDTLGTQFIYDTLLSEKHVACPYCSQESLLALGTPLAEALIKKHCDNEQYREVLLCDPTIMVELYNQIPKKQTKNENGCYIATAVYNSYDCPEVWILRRFRDNVLLDNLFGKLFVKFYYFISPTIVKYFGKTQIFNMLFRKLLDNFTKYLNNKGFQNTPYKDKL